jgi:hypothetical protein
MATDGAAPDCFVREMLVPCVAVVILDSEARHN